MVTASRETAKDGRPAIRLKPDAALLAQAFAAKNEVRAEFQADSSVPVVYLDLPGAVLLDKLKQTAAVSATGGNSGTANTSGDTISTISANTSGPAVIFAVNSAEHHLPLRWLNGLKPALEPGMVVTLGIIWPASAAVNDLRAVLAQQGAELIGSPVAFSVEVNGEPVESLNSTFSSKYLGKTLPLPAPADPLRSAVVWVDRGNKVHFVPAVFGTKTAEAAIHSPRNGMFAAVQSRHTFADTSGHEAEADIQLIANKWIMQGVSQTSFAPDASLTRAELAALLVRALGWMEPEHGRSFADVSLDSWYTPSVTAAHSLGLLTGYEDGSFRPNAQLTHEQLAAVISRALALAGKAPQTNGLPPDAFADADTIAPWAAEPVAMLLEAGLLQSSESANFSPKAPVTRAESAVILRRMLQYLQFINR